MSRKFCDLLTFPMSRGGRDTPSRLLLVGAALGYSGLGMDLGRWRGPLRGIRGIECIEVAEEGSREARRALVCYARGTGARRAASSGSADFILPDPKDTVTLKFAAQSSVPVAYPYSSLVIERSTRRSNLLRRWSVMHANCVRFGCQELLVSATDDSYLLRDPRDLTAMLHSSIGVGIEEALDWLSTNQFEVIENAEERRSA